MRNNVFYTNEPADKLSLPVPDGTVSGDPVVVGALVGVAATSKGEGGNEPTNASVWLAGVYDLTVTTAATVGQALYKPAAAKTLTTSATDNVLFGHAVEAKGSGSAVIRVKLAKV